MGEFWDKVFPSYNAKPRNGKTLELAVGVDDLGGLVNVPDPPNIMATSFPTNPSTVVQIAATAYDQFGKVSRNRLLNIPAAHGVFNLLTGVAASLPLHAVNGYGVEVDHPLLGQPEKNYPKVVTIARTAGDIILDGAALWVVVERVGKWPSYVRRVPKTHWTQNQSTGEVTLSGQRTPVDPADVILFPALEDGGILSICAQPVRMYYALQRARMNYLDNPQAREYFQGGENAPENDEVQQFLRDWRQARQDGVTGYVPFGVTLQQIQMMTPEQLAMQACEESIVAEFARMLNVDPGWLALSITTRTYSNIIDERRNFLDFNLAPQVVMPIEQRLSMNDITPNGTKVKANIDAFLRSDTLSRYQAYNLGLTGGYLTVPEVRDTEDKPPIDEQSPKAG